MEFRRKREEIVLYGADGRPITTWVEVRVHPLTGEISRILNVPFKQRELPDLERMAEETRGTCPFCPSQLAEKTPTFDPAILREGILKKGRAVLLPNRFPYDRYCALIILTEAHYVPLEAWNAGEIFDGLSLAQRFLNRIEALDKEVQAFSLNWNFAPHAGSSILHPHMQLSVGPFATNRARCLVKASWEAMLMGKDLMAEMLDTEREENLRWCGAVGPWHLLFAFAPRGRFFEINLLHEAPGCFPSLSDQDIEALAEGIVHSLRFVVTMGFSSMNLSLFSPLRESGLFHPLVSISPRACIGSYQMSDISFQMLIDEFFALFSPEDVARRYKNERKKAGLS